MDPRPTSPSTPAPGAPSSSSSELTRRDFVRSSVATGLGVGLGSGLIGLSSARAADARARRGSDQIKIALVGCGGRGTGAAIQALNGKSVDGRDLTVNEAKPREGGGGGGRGGYGGGGGGRGGRSW